MAGCRRLASCLVWRIGRQRSPATTADKPARLRTRLCGVSSVVAILRRVRAGGCCISCWNPRHALGMLASSPVTNRSMTYRRSLGLAMFVLLVGVSAGCSSPSKSGTPTEGGRFAANQAWRSGISVRAMAGDAEAQWLLGLMYYKPGPDVTGTKGQIFNDQKDSFGIADYVQAASWFRKAADQGDARGQYLLGRMYEKGEGVPADPTNPTQALIWYRRAADQGLAAAQFALGSVYSMNQWGKGQRNAGDESPPPHFAQALTWYGKAAEQGYVRAQLALGDMYSNGTGVPQDSAQALIWYRKAADQGDPIAQSYVGWMYDHGVGVVQDPAQTAIWYRKAADQQHLPSLYYLGTMYQQGRGVPKDPEQAGVLFRKAADSTAGEFEVTQFNLALKYDTAKVFRPDVRQTIAWHENAAAQGYAPAQFTIGLMSYVDSSGFGRSGAKAVTWYRKAADQGYPPAQFILGMSYDSGAIVPQDSAQAVIWYRKAADRGLADAQFRLGMSYANGTGVPQDLAQAVIWYRKAADQGLADAQFRLGMSYANGTGVPRDMAQAVIWYRKAADQGLPDVQSILGLSYWNGVGVPQDDVEAYKWLTLAVSRATGGQQRRDVENRDFLAKRMSPAQLAAAQTLSREWVAEFEKQKK